MNHMLPVNNKCRVMDRRLISLAVPGKRENDITARTIKAVTISIFRSREAKSTAVNIAAFKETVPTRFKDTSEVTESIVLFEFTGEGFFCVLAREVFGAVYISIVMKH
jgi:hypothetical protein